MAYKKFDGIKDQIVSTSFLICVDNQLFEIVFALPERV